jgi:hypothetical protein
MPNSAAANREIRVVTIVGGIDIVGEIVDNPPDTGWEIVRQPFLLLLQGQQMVLKPMLCEPNDNKCIIAGEYATINMRNVLWINPPTNTLKKTYDAARVGLVIPGPQAKVVGLNQ